MCVFPFFLLAFCLTEASSGRSDEDSMLAIVFRLSPFRSRHGYNGAKRTVYAEQE